MSRTSSRGSCDRTRSTFVGFADWEVALWYTLVGVSNLVCELVLEALALDEGDAHEGVAPEAALA